MGSRLPRDLEQCAMEQRIELYYETHPTGPSAVRRPILTKQGQVWRAVLGSKLRERIVGAGSTVEQALRAFDEEYFKFLRPGGASPAGAAGRLGVLLLATLP